MNRGALKTSEADASEALALIKQGWIAEIYVGKKEGGLYCALTGDVRTISLESFCQIMPKVKVTALDGVIRLKAKGPHA